MKTTNECGYCSAAIPKTKKYCNLSCAGKVPRKKSLERLMTTTCATCSNDFTHPKAEKRKFCSKKCSTEMSRLNLIPKSKAKVTTVICGNKACQKEIKTVVKRKFCNSKCSAAAISERSLQKFLDGEYDGTESAVPKAGKKLILREQDYKCAICSMEQVWEGKPLVFIFDHIDGNAMHTVRSNLRAICPNCNSQTETFGAKNLGKGRHYRRQRYAQGLSY